MRVPAFRTQVTVSIHCDERQMTWNGDSRGREPRQYSQMNDQE
jgi:hypothetical protein